jgi:hypothetical protein
MCVYVYWIVLSEIGRGNLTREIRIAWNWDHKNIVPLELWTLAADMVATDRCYDFKNIFAKKSAKQWAFWLTAKLNYAKIWS